LKARTASINSRADKQHHKTVQQLGVFEVWR